MPSLARGAAAHASADVDLARWLGEQGHPCSPARVARWRIAGLLPPPDRPAVPRGRPGRGRPARRCSPEARHDAEVLALRLVALARRGRPADRVALRLFAEGLPVPGNTVRAAAVALLAALEHRLRTEIGVPDEPARDPWDDGGLLTAVDAYVDREPALQAAVRGRLRGVDVAEDGADARSVTVALVGGILGQPPADDEEQLLELALHAHGAHGLLEPAGPGVPRVLDDGVADVAHAIGRVSLPGLRAALARLPDHRVAHAWGLLTRLGEALRAVPPDRAHHLGGAAALGAVDLREPSAAALLLGVYAVLSEELGDDLPARVGEIVDAVRAAGWSR